MQINRTIVAIILSSMLGCFQASADGIMMSRDYHFMSGTRVSLSLSPDQIAQLETQRKGEQHLHTASVDLTPSQTELIHSKTGRTVTELNVFERGWNDCGCCAHNIASRYAADKVEVTSDHLTDTIILKAGSRAFELLKTRRQHWWQFWRRRYVKDQDAFDRALRELKAENSGISPSGHPH